MNKILRLTILVIFCLAFGLHSAQELLAQVTDTTGTGNGLRGAPRVYKYDTRSISMGNATVADPTVLSSININPATLPFVREQTLHLNIHQNWDNNLMLENLTFPVFQGREHHVAGQVALHQGGAEATNLIGTAPNPQPNLSLYQMDIAYSYVIENVFSLGILNSFNFAQNERAQYWTYYPVLGIMYAPSQSVTYGMSFRGLGRSVTYFFAGDGFTALGSQDLREVLEIGATLHYPVDVDPDQVLFSISLANEKRFGEPGIWYKGGFELKYFEQVSLRTGILFDRDIDLYVPRFGIGYESDAFSIDYGISYEPKHYERFHQLGITIHLGSFGQ